MVSATPKKTRRVDLNGGSEQPKPEESEAEKSEAEKSEASESGDNKRSTDQWATIINSEWRRSIEGILKTGQLLLDARAELEWGNLEEELYSKLAFGAGTAQALMRIARNKVFPQWIEYLPANWAALDELRKIPDEPLEKLVASGQTRDISVEDAKLLVAATKDEGNKYDPTKLVAAFMLQIKTMQRFPNETKLAPKLAEVLSLKTDFRWTDFEALSEWVPRLIAATGVEIHKVDGDSVSAKRVVIKHKRRL
jgi:hypothetical protein